MLKKLIVPILLISFLFILVGVAQAKSGCCSWHGGVSYCDTSVGRYVCRDNTYSPSCGCYKAPSQIELIKAEIIKVKADYYKNPNWFREKLINKLNYDKSLVAFYVYTMLPDIIIK